MPTVCGIQFGWCLQNVVLLWMVVLAFVVKTSGIVVTPNIFCDGVVCKCGSDVVICECTKTIQGVKVPPKQIPVGAGNLTIFNCATVHFETNSIKLARGLRSVNIRNVQKLYLPEKALEWDGDGEHPYAAETPRLSIHITNTTIPEISGHVFNGKIRDITLIKVHVSVIKPFAFSNLNSNERILIQDSVIGSVQLQGFKKFTTKIIVILNTTFGSDLVSRTFSDLTIQELFRIGEGSHFKTIKPSAFIINSPKKVDISDSYFDSIDSEGFRILANGDTAIKNTYIRSVQAGAFSGISVNPFVVNYGGKKDFSFTNNTALEIYPHSFDVNHTSYNLQLYSVHLNITCTCDNIVKWDSIFSAQLDSVNCLSDVKNQKNEYINAGRYKTKYCSAKAKTLKTVIIVMTILFILVILSAVVGTFLYRRYKGTHQTEWINNASPLAHRKSRNSTSSKSSKSSNGKLPIIMPDGRTYRETIVVVEQAELLTTEL